jgi:hypothetical protein
MRCLSVFLAFLVAAPLSPPAAAQVGSLKLNLVVVEGDGAINNIRQRTARDTIVQLEDENHRPIAGAVVVFTAPSEGAGGTFAGGAHSVTVISDSQGRAIARAFRPNGQQGNFQIHVNASYQGQTTSANITQTNSAAAGAASSAAAAGISAKLVVVLAVVGAAAAGGALAATHLGGGSSSSSSTSGSGTSAAITITPGSVVVGAPH